MKAEIKRPITLQEIPHLAHQMKINLYEKGLNKLANRDDYISALLLGLNDDDNKIRRRSAQLTDHLLVALQENAIKGGNPLTDLSDLPKLKAQMISLLSDPDDEIRGFIITSLPLIEEPNPKIEEILLNHFEKESNTELKAELLSRLADCAYTGKQFQDVLVKSLDHPDKTIRMHAAEAIKIVRPPEALPKLVKLLSSDNEMFLDPVAFAIASYREKAQPFLPQLEAAIANPVNRGTWLDRAKLALQQIKGAVPPRPLDQAKIIPVSLL